MFTGTMCIVMLSITSLLKWGNFNLGNPKHHSMTKKIRSIHMYPLAIMSMYILQKSMKCYSTKTSTAIAISYQLSCLNKPTKTLLSCIRHYNALCAKGPITRFERCKQTSAVHRQWWPCLQRMKQLLGVDVVEFQTEMCVHFFSGKPHFKQECNRPTKHALPIMAHDPMWSAVSAPWSRVEKEETGVQLFIQTWHNSLATAHGRMQGRCIFMGYQRSTCDRQHW